MFKRNKYYLHKNGELLLCKEVNEKFTSFVEQSPLKMNYSFDTYGQTILDTVDKNPITRESLFEELSKYMGIHFSTLKLKNNKDKPDSVVIPAYFNLLTTIKSVHQKEKELKLQIENFPKERKHLLEYIGFRKITFKNLPPDGELIVLIDNKGNKRLCEWVLTEANGTKLGTAISLIHPTVSYDYKKDKKDFHYFTTDLNSIRKTKVEYKIGFDPASGVGGSYVATVKKKDETFYIDKKEIKQTKP